MALNARQSLRTFAVHEFAPAVSIWGGVVLALVWSALFSTNYQRIVNGAWKIDWAKTVGLNSSHQLIASGLMTLFFFAIGLELAREISSGFLTSRRQSLAPIMGALGGMCVTALLSVVVGNFSHSEALRSGWGVPMATDVAFTLGALALVGSRLPRSLRTFLLALAVADDVASVTVLAFNGHLHIRPWWLLVTLLLIVGARRIARVRSRASLRALFLLLLWLSLLGSGIEPPLAGILAAVTVPLDAELGLALERQMSQWSAMFVLPLFAVASCGVRWDLLRSRASVTIIIATIAIRLVGKTIGIMGGVALARAVGSRVHHEITWPMLFGSSLLCAIGFTVPLLFASALFSTNGSIYGAFAAGLLAASVLAAVGGVMILRRVSPSLS